MRSRNLKPGFFKNEYLIQLEPLTRILFAGLWGMADRSGRLEDRPQKIKIEVLPCDNCDVNSMLQKLHDSGLIVRYRVEPNAYIQIPKFLDHQFPHHREPVSKIPEFNAKNQSAQGKPRSSPKKVRPSPAVSVILNPESPILNPESGILTDSFVATTALRLADLLKSLILENDAKAKTPKDLTAWAGDIERLMRIDKRTEPEVEAVIRWCQADSFWRSNILSGKKLREKFTQLALKMAERKGGPNGTSVRLDVKDPERLKSYAD